MVKFSAKLDGEVRYVIYSPGVLSMLNLSRRTSQYCLLNFFVSNKCMSSLDSHVALASFLPVQVEKRRIP